MSAEAAPGAPAAEKTLHRLFLTLFLRGRSSRGLRRGGSPKSLQSKLGVTLLFYTAAGALALMSLGKPVFTLALTLHGMTLLFLGMSIAGSAGEVLFNKDEAEILLHRPVTARELLRAKVKVLVQVSLWLAGAFNLVGLFVGVWAPDGGWLFPLAHAVSTVLERSSARPPWCWDMSFACAGLAGSGWKGLMTTVQILIAVGTVGASQIVPRVIARLGPHLELTRQTWWMGLLPPAWFAGLDDLIAGRQAAGSPVLAILAWASRRWSCGWLSTS